MERRVVVVLATESSVVQYRTIWSLKGNGKMAKLATFRVVIFTGVINYVLTMLR
jgi:hypothetical protein